MAFTPQNEDGTVEGANAYIDVAALRAYWDDRGVDLSAYSDDQAEVAIIKATDYLDARYKWVGYQLYRLQGTQWPRGGVTTFLRGLPPALKNATCMMAQRAFTKALMPDPTYDPSGQKVTESTKKVGPIEVSLKYSDGGNSNAASKTPEYPEVTLMLQAAGLVGSGVSGDLVRG